MTEKLYDDGYKITGMLLLTLKMEEEGHRSRNAGRFYHMVRQKTSLREPLGGNTALPTLLILAKGNPYRSSDLRNILFL